MISGSGTAQLLVLAWVALGSLPTGVVLLQGFVLGLRHALDADHLAAVSTIVGERQSWLSSSLVGGLWGIGHTLSLLVAGAAVIFLRVRISERWERTLEFGVGLMLVGLGARALVALLRGRRMHQRGHLHPHIHQAGAPSPSGLGVGKRPLLIGMVHGLAGSAALLLLVLGSISSPAVGLIYIAIFGLGSVGGMMLMSSLIGLPFHLTASRFRNLHLAARTLAGLFSLTCGLLIIYEKGYADGLLR